MGGLEAVITGLMDEFKIKIKREYFTIIIVLTSFTGALINCTQVCHLIFGKLKNLI